LVVGNSGTNDFTGGISIEAGKIQIAGGNDRLPVNASVTLADVATAELDLNNFNQSLLSLNGGGTIGGNVKLGTGTLTITGASSFAGVISGSGSLNKSGAGTLTLSGANNYSGGTNFSGNGVLALAHSTAAGSGPIQFATTQTGTAATFTLRGGINVANNDRQLDAATGRNTINSHHQHNTLSGNITINNNSATRLFSKTKLQDRHHLHDRRSHAQQHHHHRRQLRISSRSARQNGEPWASSTAASTLRMRPSISITTAVWTVNSTGNSWAVHHPDGSTANSRNQAGREQRPGHRCADRHDQQLSRRSQRLQPDGGRLGWLGHRCANQERFGFDRLHPHPRRTHRRSQLRRRHRRWGPTAGKSRW
jgi:autotransporter-associated beta strand protein